MLLGFKTTNNGLDTGFVRKILANPHLVPGRDFDYYAPERQQAITAQTPAKIHTLRGLSNPITAGAKIHFATGVRTKNCRVFAIGVCTATQIIRFCISPSGKLLVAVVLDNRFGHVFSEQEKLIFARNDGFDTVEAFDAWFKPLVDLEGGAMEKKLIHWTDLRYTGPNPFGRKPQPRTYEQAH